jgi:hypothetical protein
VRRGEGTGERGEQRTEKEEGRGGSKKKYILASTTPSDNPD